MSSSHSERAVPSFTICAVCVVPGFTVHTWRRKPGRQVTHRLKSDPRGYRGQSHAESRPGRETPPSAPTRPPGRAACPQLHRNAPGEQRNLAGRSPERQWVYSPASARTLPRIPPRSRFVALLSFLRGELMIGAITSSDGNELDVQTGISQRPDFAQQKCWVTVGYWLRR